MIPSEVENYCQANKRYHLLKAKMIRQGLIAESDLIQKTNQKVQEEKKESQMDSKMRATAFKFQDGGIGDPSLGKLKEDIRQKEL
jgi:hypothetical protein